MLEDIFIELILKKDKNDEEYKDLDIYFSFVDEIITLENIYTSINSLTLRDCPLFAIEGDIFNSQIENRIKVIDIDENSLINPSIVTKFKIKNQRYEICFDLDSFKLKIEEKGDNNKYDYIDYLDYIFNIIIEFNRDNQKIVEDKKNWDDIEDGLGDLNRKKLYKLIFKNFDTTKFEYIYDDELTFIKEKDWILDEEEKKKKERWEKLENDLQNYDFEKLSEVKEVVFDNCSNFFVKWILHFIKGKNNEIRNLNDDLNLLKIKKCGKDYIDLNNILTMRIKNVILFDSPLIIPGGIKNNNLASIVGNLGTFGNLTIKINSLDCYGKQYNLDTYKTLEILVEIIKENKFNRNLTFELSSLSSIMTYLGNEEYLKNPTFYKEPNDEERGKDEINNDILKGVVNENDIIKEKFTYLPKHIFFSSKRKRDFIYYTPSFNLKCLEGAIITLQNLTIKKTTENFDNQNYYSIKLNKQTKSYTDNNDLKKIDFGSDNFSIDRDFKFFFSENHIGTVELLNVTFSNFKDNNLKDIEQETIINLMSNNNEEENSIHLNNYNRTHFPNYRIDVKTLNGVLYRNFFFENIGIMFKYFMYIIEPQNENEKRNMISNDAYEKKKTLVEYFKKFKAIFDCFTNITKITIIINNVKELKEFYCTLCVLKVVIKEENWITEKVCVQSNKKNDEITLPSKKMIEKEIGNYFIKDKNEEEAECYSEMDYYYSSYLEKKMVKDKQITIGENTFYLDFKFEDEYYQEV